MKPAFLLLPLLLLATSCATVLNRKVYTANFSSSQNNVSVVVNDSVYKLPAEIKLRRSKEDLYITVLHDTIRTEAVIEHAMSPTFFYANASLLEFCPILYGVDLLSQKRFYYGRNLVIDDSTAVYKPSVFNPYKEYFVTDEFYGTKGGWKIALGMPYGNLFFMRPKNLGHKRGGGFFGLFLEAEYYYDTRKFLSVKASSAIDFVAPVPAPVMTDGAYEGMIAHTFTLMNNHLFGREIIGYGLNYGIYSWRLHSSDYGVDPLAPPSSKKDSHAFGASINLQHQFSSEFSFGVAYNAGIYNVFPQGKFLYQHVISFEFTYRISELFVGSDR